VRIAAIFGIVAIVVAVFTACNNKNGDGTLTYAYTEITHITSKPLSATSATFANITVKVDVPVEWTIDLTDSTGVGCRWGIRAITEIGFPGFAVNVPAHSSSRTDPAYADDIFKPGNQYVIEFTPTSTGEFQLKCVEMGMNICKTIVVEEIKD
jgi:hypothetical protein